ncbi:hypothetical protein BX666DRAFT_1975265 [Dichotomocladium elegans]|nr:hypothetical protein BX666DRAFT_1975265 [Dichotomocladium elegans]
MFEKLTDKFNESMYILKFAGFGVKELLSSMYSDLRALTKNPHFKLIHVRRDLLDNTKVEMQLVTPVNSWMMRRRLEMTEYYCVSHLWGDPSEWETWTDHGILGEDGQTPVSVRIRPDKKQKLLGLLAEKGGYWWVDIFCAQQATPLEIMGKIYGLSRRTYCLLDCEPRSIKTLVDAEFSETMKKKFADAQEALIDGYLAQVDGHEDDETVDWEDVVEDTVGWWYREDKTSGSGDDEAETAAAAAAAAVTTVSDVLGALCSLFRSEWFTRVWTLQEVVLPTQVSFLAESGDCYEALDRDTDMVNIVHVCHAIVQEANLKLTAVNKRAKMTADKLYLMLRIQGSMQEDLLITYAMQKDFLLDAYPRLIRTLALERRRCLDPRDYVYGVAGVLCIDVPKLEDPCEVWNAFLDALHERSPRITLPRNVDLQEATCLSEVFGHFDLDELKKLDNLGDD